MRASEVVEVLSRRPLSREESTATFGCFVDGAYSEVEMAAVLAGLKTRGESPEVMAGAVEAVARAGVKPHEVTDVILTHAHWDHADGADLFPKATVWIQKDEYTYYTGAAWQAGGQHGGIDPEDMAALLRINTQGRLRLVDGDQEILPGVRVHIGGRHTWQSQYASVPTRSGPVVLASDNMYLYENLEKHAPIAQTFDRESNLKAQDQMKALAGANGKIVPGHDPISDNMYLYENLEKHAPIAQTFDRESNLKAQDQMKALAGANGKIVPGHDP